MYFHRCLELPRLSAIENEIEMLSLILDVISRPVQII